MRFRGPQALGRRVENRIRHAGFPRAVVDYCSALTKFSYGFAGQRPELTGVTSRKQVAPARRSDLKPVDRTLFAFDRQQLDVEDQGGIRRDIRTGAALPIGK